MTDVDPRVHAYLAAHATAEHEWARLVSTDYAHVLVVPAREESARALEGYRAAAAAAFTASSTGRLTRT